MPMSLDDFVNKYGPESGKKRYLGLQKCLDSRKKTYNSHPYPRLTKEWFMWRYPVDGEQRFEMHVAKSIQSLENFIQRYGVDDGTTRYQETMLKKNTVAIVKSKLGKDAIDAWYAKSSSSHKYRLASMDPDEYSVWSQRRVEKSRQTKKDRYGDKSKLEIFIDKYGENGPTMYAEYLQKIFKSIGASAEAETLIKSIISDNPWLQKYTLYYRDSNLLNSVEWFIADKSGVCFYDFCVKERKVILEYDGSRWHPTLEQVEKFGDEIMQVIGISYREKYNRDIDKRVKAEKHGFTVFTVRADFTIAEKTTIIEKFLKKVKNDGKIY